MINRKTSNKILIMYVIDYLKEVNNYELRLQSLIFQIQRNMRALGITNTFNYKFVNWTYGPYSRELSEDLNYLLLNNMVYEYENRLSLDDHGNEVLNTSKPLFDKFITFDDCFFQTIDMYGDLKIDDLLLNIYDNNELIKLPMGKVIEDLMYVYNEY